MKEIDIKQEWKRNKKLFPDKIEANDQEFCPIPTIRAVFSSGRNILDIEDIAGNNIRIVENEEAKWLIDVLQRYIKNQKAGDLK